MQGGPLQSAALSPDQPSSPPPRVISHLGAEEDLSHEKAVWDQYRAWKRHIPKLYEHLTVHPLEWPTLTVDWIPEDDNRDEEGYTKNFLLIGTQAFEPPSAEEQRAAAEAATNWEEKKPRNLGARGREREQRGNNFVYNLRCYLPTVPESGFAISDQFYRHAGKVELQQKLHHESGVVNCIRHMPQNPHIIATRGPARGSATSQLAPVFIFDLDAAPDLHHHQMLKKRQNGHVPEPESCPPYLMLYGHTQEGMCLSWNKRKRGWLASGGDDNKVLIWDIESKLDLNALQDFEKDTTRHRQKNGVMPLIELKSGGGTAHDDAVQGVDFHPTHEHLLFSVGDDKAMRIWDLRVYDRGFVQSVKPAHNSNINCVQAHPFADHVVATCGCDGLVKVWDIRFMKRTRGNHIEPNMTLRAHSDEVTCLEWAHHSETVLATGSKDRTVIVWDIEKHGQKPFDSGTVDCCGGIFSKILPSEWQAPPKPAFHNDDLDIPPEVLFVHFGHTAPVTDISWNPSEDWMLASAAEDNFLHLWQMADRVRNDDSDDPVLGAAGGQSSHLQEAVPMAAALGPRGSLQHFPEEVELQQQSSPPVAETIGWPSAPLPPFSNQEVSSPPEGERRWSGGQAAAPAGSGGGSAAAAAPQNASGAAGPGDVLGGPDLVER
eukprot:Hpha_TRINITY_DN16263_c4_g3::TRINITY_DN16263_c4_g3_i1::g.15634::m.15634/K11659/RBBP7; histone-binding protein RBBP7